MKKILLSVCLIVSVNSFSQNIDTVFVRNLSLKKETWAIIEQWFPRGDSLEKKTYKKIGQVMENHKNSSNNTQIIFDSIPGRIASYLYARYRQSADFLTDKIGTELLTKLAAYTPLSSFITDHETGYTNEFQSMRKRGEDGWFN